MSAFGQEYRSALETYLQRGDEMALSTAYELGRRAMVEGLGILDMAQLHQDAIEKIILPAANADRQRFATAASSFFSETLSSFEMTFRGYRGANEELQRLNEALIRKTRRFSSPIASSNPSAIRFPTTFVRRFAPSTASARCCSRSTRARSTPKGSSTCLTCGWPLNGGPADR